MTEFMDRQIKLQRAGQKEYTEEEVRLIINGAIQEEREACARVAENIGIYDRDEPEISIATAIRARGQA
jgi:hypothetical protein